jgi:hypothetical protein
VGIVRRLHDTEAIRLNPNYADAYYNRGVNYGEKKQYDKAISEHKAVMPRMLLTRFPSNPR